MNYTRAGSTIAGFGFTSLISDALFKQGVTFTVLGHGYDVNPQIQDLGFRFFSIGGVTDTITQGFIGQTFFGCPNLGDANSALLALNGTSYAHSMSYFAHSNYLGGEGYGSSYILELYADFGFGGIIVGSFILGVAFPILSMLIGRGWFGGMVALTAALAVFHMPRGAYIEWISFIIETRFLAAVFVIIALSAILAYVSRVFFRRGSCRKDWSRWMNRLSCAPSTERFLWSSIARNVTVRMKIGMEYLSVRQVLPE